MNVKLTQMPLPADSPILLLDSDPKPRRYLAKVERKRYSVLVSRDNIAGPSDSPDYRWHVSVAGEHAVPIWKHFVAIAHAARPGITFCVPVPPPTQWLNLHPNVLHVWEVRDTALAAQWAMEGRMAGSTPS